jgi:ketosteroid isomerase-like protein
MSPREVVLAWVDAFNRQDADTAAALYHDDAVNVQVAAGEPTIGKQAMRDGFAYVFRAFPDNYTKRLIYSSTANGPF